MKKECIAMLLAGGEGKRLGLLTRKLAKPAVPFGGKYRIIDFSLSNCHNSGIDTVGVLTQYQPLVLHTYIGIGASWGLDRKYGGATILPPFVEKGEGKWYNGTANAIYQNIYFIEQYNPDYILIISGDHIYQMDYSKMLAFHKERSADLTIAAVQVPWEEASRFGAIITGKDHHITGFEEKAKEPKSNLASMGVYVFTWKILKKYLVKDEKNPDSSHDFGKDVIPLMLKEKNRLFTYPFEGYWKDVGTVESFAEANLDLLEENPELNLYNPRWKIYSVNPNLPAQYIAPTARIKRSLVNDGCVISGEVINSVLFYGVEVGRGSVIKDSVVMPNVKIGNNVMIQKAIIGSETIIADDCRIGYFNADEKGFVLIGEGKQIKLSKDD